MNEPLYSCAALGFRCFKVSENLLYPLNGGGHRSCQHAWQPGANLAECGLGLAHQAPGQDCGCGFHAYHATVLPSRVVLSEPEWVLAAVAGAGRLRVHKHGWRSQKVQILGLWGDQEIGSLAAAYQVPALATLRELREFASDLAQPIAQELRPRRSDDAAELAGWFKL